MRMNSTNLSEESDVYSDSEDHVDIESSMEDSPPKPEVRNVQDRLRGDDKSDVSSNNINKHNNHSNDSTTIKHHFPSKYDGQSLNRNNIFSKCSSELALAMAKPASRPSFLITDILSNTNCKRDIVSDTENTDSSVPNTPCSPTTSYSVDIHRTAALLAQRQAALQQSPLTDRSESPCSEDGRLCFIVYHLNLLLY